MTGFIPKEKLTAYQRWELAAFDETGELPPATLPQKTDAPQTPGPVDQPPALTLATAEEVERIYTEAQESGYAAGQTAGHSAGYEEGIAQARLEAAQVNTLLENLQQALQAFDQGVADQLLTLAIEIASQVLRQSLRVKPDLLLPVIREAVASLPIHQGHPALFVTPSDAILIRAQLGELLSHNNWRIIEDSRLEAGGCRVEIGASEVDATLETRWRRVIESIGVSKEWLDAQS
jgi:flagellar assembly protein FliH